MERFVHPPPPAKPYASQQGSSLVSQWEASILKWPNMACPTAKEAPDGCNIQSNSSFICHMWWTNNAFIIILLDWEKHHWVVKLCMGIESGPEWKITLYWAGQYLALIQCREKKIHRKVARFDLDPLYFWPNLADWSLCGCNHYFRCECHPLNHKSRSSRAISLDFTY